MLGTLSGAIPELQLLLLAIISGVAVWLTLVICRQRWAQTFANTTTYLLLPCIGLVIVQVISDSIALSLGMIGALSIVRFRHPVKSPLELTVFFLLLTVGIAITQRPGLAVLLTAISCLLIIVVSLIKGLSTQHSSKFRWVIGDDGRHPILLEIVSSAPIPSIEASRELAFSYADIDGGQYHYKLALESHKELLSWRSELTGVLGIRSITETVAP